MEIISHPTGGQGRNPGLGKLHLLMDEFIITRTAHLHSGRSLPMLSQTYSSTFPWPPTTDGAFRWGEHPHKLVTWPKSSFAASWSHLEGHQRGQTRRNQHLALGWSFWPCSHLRPWDPSRNHPTRGHWESIFCPLLEFQLFI